MRSRRIEQGVCLAVALYAAAAVVWFVAIEYRGWKQTGIMLPAKTYFRFAVTLGLAVLFGAAFWASRTKEREEREKHSGGQKENPTNRLPPSKPSQ